MANLDVGERASAYVLQMESTAQDVRIAMGSDELMVPGAVGRWLEVLTVPLAQSVGGRRRASAVADSNPGTFKLRKKFGLFRALDPARRFCSR